MGAIKKHILLGIGSAILLTLFYLGLIALAQGLSHALEQGSRLWYWVLALAAGFGLQVGLFSFIRQGIHQRQVATTSSVATSGTVSAGSMVACCAHHLSEILPLLGLSGAAIFLVRYQLFFIIVGLLANVVGITIMLEVIQRHGLCPQVTSWRWNMSWVKKGVIATAVLILTTAFFFTLYS